ncbi:MAG TPA: hypothetical protein VII25_13940 [Candidatus Acidoferrum sp.]
MSSSDEAVPARRSYALVAGFAVLKLRAMPQKQRGQAVSGLPKRAAPLPGRAQAVTD